MMEYDYKKFLEIIFENNKKIINEKNKMKNNKKIIREKNKIKNN